MSFKILQAKRASRYPGHFGLDNSVKYNHAHSQRLVCGLWNLLQSFKNVVSCIVFMSSI